MASSISSLTGISGIHAVIRVSPIQCGHLKMHQCGLGCLHSLSGHRSFSSLSSANRRTTLSQNKQVLSVKKTFARESQEGRLISEKSRTALGKLFSVLQDFQKKLSEAPKFVETLLENNSESQVNQNPASVGMILGSLLSLSLLLSTPDFASAAQGGGRVGGRVSSESRSYSPPSQTYVAPSTTIIAPTFSTPYYAPSPFFGGWGWSPFYAGPTVVVGGGGGLGGLVSLLVVGVVLMFVANAVFGFLGDREEDDVYSTTTSVLRLQVGLLGMARGLQRDLDRLAERADTSSVEGLQYVLTETTLSLLRHPDYCVYGTAMTSVKGSAEEGEGVFNSLSLEERGKFREETLVNVGDVTRKVERISKGDGFTSEYIVVTIIVAAEGSWKLPEVKNSTDLREALTTLGSVTADSLQAVEILWTPQNSDDSLSEREMLTDYPQLRAL